MNTARFVLKLVAAGLALAASVCLVIAFWEQLVCLLCGRDCAECDDYDDALLYEED